MIAEQYPDNIYLTDCLQDVVVTTRINDIHRKYSADVDVLLGQLERGEITRVEWLMRVSVLLDNYDEACQLHDDFMGQIHNPMEAPIEK